MTRLGPAELQFVTSQRIGRLVTVSPAGWPQVVPVLYALTDDGEFEFDVDGAKLRNLAADARAALVVDATGPKRGVSVQGRCSLIRPERARLEPSHVFSWGL